MRYFTKSELRGLYKELLKWELQSVATAADLNTRTLYYWLAEEVENPRPENVRRVASVIGYRFKK